MCADDTIEGRRKPGLMIVEWSHEYDVVNHLLDNSNGAAAQTKAKWCKDSVVGSSLMYTTAL